MHRIMVIDSLPNKAQEKNILLLRSLFLLHSNQMFSYNCMKGHVSLFLVCLFIKCQAGHSYYEARQVERKTWTAQHEVLIFSHDSKLIKKTALGVKYTLRLLPSPFSNTK